MCGMCTENVCSGVPETANTGYLCKTQEVENEILLLYNMYFIMIVSFFLINTHFF